MLNKNPTIIDYVNGGASKIAEWKKIMGVESSELIPAIESVAERFYATVTLSVATLVSAAITYYGMTNFNMVDFDKNKKNIESGVQLTSIVVGGAATMWFIANIPVYSGSTLLAPTAFRLLKRRKEGGEFAERDFGNRSTVDAVSGENNSLKIMIKFYENAEVLGGSADPAAIGYIERGHKIINDLRGR